MCFRVELIPKANSKRDLKGLKFDLDEGIEDLFGTTVFPKKEGLIISQFEGKNKIQSAMYSLVPHWMKSPDFKFSTYNSRSEDVLEKRTFKPYFLGSRCLVPIKAFYEYSGARGSEKRLVYRSTIEGEATMMAAGIFSVYTDENKVKHPTFAIMTVDPSKRLKELYERMPVVLGEQYWDFWLDREQKDPKALQEVCETWDNEKMIVELVPKEGDREVVIDPSSKKKVKK